MPIKISQSVSPVILPIQLELVSYIESYGNYVKIHSHDNAVSIKRTTLKAILAELPREFFCRIHNRYIVNLSQIRSFHHSHNNGARITLKQDPHIQLQVSRSYLSPFRKCYNQFIMYDIPFAKNDPGYCF